MRYLLTRHVSSKHCPKQRDTCEVKLLILFDLSIQSNGDTAIAVLCFQNDCRI